MLKLQGEVWDLVEIFGFFNTALETPFHFRLQLWSSMILVFLNNPQFPLYLFFI